MNMMTSGLTLKKVPSRGRNWSSAHLQTREGERGPEGRRGVSGKSSRTLQASGEIHRGSPFLQYF